VYEAIGVCPYFATKGAILQQAATAGHPLFRCLRDHDQAARQLGGARRHASKLARKITTWNVNSLNRAAAARAGLDRDQPRHVRACRNSSSPTHFPLEVLRAPATALRRFG